MRLVSLTQLNARNLTTPRVDFPAGIIAVVGQNASGKSNLLEAAYLGCTGSTASRTVEFVRLGEEEGYVAAEVEYRGGAALVEVGLSPGRRVVRLDGQQVRAADVARSVTAVLLSPEDAELVHGAPSGRRSFLDGLLTRLSARYAAYLREYQRVLEQRNALLKRAPSDPSLTVWTERFAALGEEIEAVRERATARIALLAAESYTDIAGAGAPHLGVTLRKSHPYASLAEAAAATAAEERIRGVTTVGPHRDDLLLELGGHALKEYGSRGEARTAALALKVAEYRLLSEKHGEAPVLLIDDFTAELDEGRRAFLLTLAASTPQTIVSGTEPPPHFDQLLLMSEGRVSVGGAARA